LPIAPAGFRRIFNLPFDLSDELLFLEINQSAFSLFLASRGAPREKSGVLRLQD